MRVLIRADASRVIGTGHIARCLTLAVALRQQGAEVVFVCRLLPGHLLERLQQNGFRVYGLPAQYPSEGIDAGSEALLPWQSDIEAMQAALVSELPFDWLIVDHYGFQAQWESAARILAPRIMVIDDLANRSHDADLLLDQNMSATPAAYAPWISPHCECLFGPRFALLRDEFRGRAVPIRSRVNRVLVNFGGVDVAGQTLATMRALSDFPELSVDFVAGSANPDWLAMQALTEQHAAWNLHEVVSDFAALMAKADLFIGAGGGTTWERAAFGLPTICIAVAANQQANAEQLAEAGAHLYLGPHEQLAPQRLPQAIGLLMDNHGLRKSLARQSRALVDGAGVQRVCVALTGKLLALRQASAEDSQLLFDGRNAERVRRWSFDDLLIEPESHQRWFSQSLTNPERLLLIGEAVDGPVGVVRYDRQGERVQVSIYLFEGRGGWGWGRVLLDRGERFLKTRWPRVSLISAHVMPDNAASCSLFRSSGYNQDDCHFQRVLTND